MPTPARAAPHPSHSATLTETDRHRSVERIGVRTTLVCIKKDARAASETSNPALISVCVRAFHTASSNAARTIPPRQLLLALRFGESSAYFFPFLFRHKTGKKTAAAMKPRTALRAEFKGAPGNKNSCRMHTFKDP